MAHEIDPDYEFIDAPKNVDFTQLEREERHIDSWFGKSISEGINTKLTVYIDKYGNEQDHSDTEAEQPDFRSADLEIIGRHIEQSTPR